MPQPVIQGPHIVDQPIAEGAPTLSRWRPARWALRHLLGPVLHNDAAVELADAVAALDGHAAMRPIRDRLALRVDARGLEHVPEGRTGADRAHPTCISVRFPSPGAAVASAAWWVERSDLSPTSR